MAGGGGKNDVATEEAVREMGGGWERWELLLEEARARALSLRCLGVVSGFDVVGSGRSVVGGGWS